MHPILITRFLLWRINERLNLDERGQTATEYMGIIVIVALIIAAIVTTGGIPEAISNGVRTQIDKVLQQGGG